MVKASATGERPPSLGSEGTVAVLLEDEMELLLVEEASDVEGGDVVGKGGTVTEEVSAVGDVVVEVGDDIVEEGVMEGVVVGLIPT